MTLPVAEPRYDVARKGTALGSFRLLEIATEIDSGNLRWTDDCWTEGMESWAKLGDIRDLLESIGTSGKPATGMSRLPLYVGIAVLSLFLVGASAYLLMSADSTEVTADTPAAPLASATSPARVALDKPLQRSLSEAQDKISMLVSASFQTNKSVTGTATFTHRYYKEIGNRIPLRVDIDADGRCHLLTFYQGRNWIFHRQLRFVIGQQTLETGVIEPHLRSRSIGEDNTVSESCRFVGPADAKLVGRLAAAADSPIAFQMVGLKPLEVPLSYETKVAIRESHELAELLAQRRKLLADLGIRP
jgi:hypothetical protein